MAFIQDPPRLGNPYDDDRVLRTWLRRRVDRGVLDQIEGALREMADLSAGPLFELARASRHDEPEHVATDTWGNRLDDVRVNALWKEAERIAARDGLVAHAYERTFGRFSRIQQFALVHLFHPSSQVYTCPLAMTDGCARTFEMLAAPALRDAVLPRLIDRDPETKWISGQWMTEQIGGSDVGASETVALDRGSHWELSGIKWFTSAITADVALTLGRPDGNPGGGKGLALFYIQARDGEGRLDSSITVHRLKEKLGTRLLPTAELTLDATRAQLVCDPHSGVKNMRYMLNLTRTWNAVSAVSLMARGLQLARDFARRRVAFGAPLSEKPLHLTTLADIAAEYEAAFQLTYRVVELMGREEVGEIAQPDLATLGFLQLLAKLTTGRQAVWAMTEVVESLGGAGYMEDSGVPELLRDGQVLPIWEGTTNVLSLESFRALRRDAAMSPFMEALKGHATAAKDATLEPAARAAMQAADRAASWLRESISGDPMILQSGARRFALTMGRSMALALLCEHAQWCIDEDGDRRSAAAALRFASHGIDLMDADGLALEDVTNLALS